MFKPGYLPTLAMLVATLTTVNAHAQTAASEDHSAHHGATSEQPDTAPAPTAADPHAGHSTTQGDAPPAMDHGDMKMQGGSAPADARDPHAYSNGLKLGEGDYAVPGVPRLMLADEHRFGSLLGETLERQFTRKGGDSTAYNFQGWYGTTYNRLALKAEGAISNGKLEESRTELLWDRAIASYWDTQVGVRLDSGEGPSRQWLAFGMQGLAPYWFELDATAYVGNGGRTALRLEASYELLISQRLILVPKVETQFYGKDDPERRIGSGLAKASAGLRLRYEISRQFAPYIGIERAGSFGKTADYVSAEGGRAKQTRFVAGLRFWF